MVSILPLWSVDDAGARLTKRETSMRFSQCGVDERPIVSAPRLLDGVPCVVLFEQSLKRR
jgi:hypothetical protein